MEKTRNGAGILLNLFLGIAVLLLAACGGGKTEASMDALLRMAVPVVIELDGAIRTLYAVRGLPTIYIIDISGEIAELYAGTLTPAALE